MIWKFILGLGLLIGLVVLYIVTYAINEKTEKPEGCEETECTACNVQSCSNRK